MDARRTNRFFAVTLVASLATATLAGSFPTRIFADEAKDKPAEAGEATATPAETATAEEEKSAETEKTVEPTRITGKIYKVDPEKRVIGVMVQLQPSRAWKQYKLFIDDKSLILVGGQPSNLDALAPMVDIRKDVEVGFFRKGKQDVIDTLTVSE